MHASASDPRQFEVAGVAGRVFRLERVVDGEAAERFEKATRAALDDGVRYFIFDFNGAEHISSGLLRLLVSLRKTVRELGEGSVEVASMPSSFRERVFEALGFSMLFTIHASVEEALREIGAEV